MSGTGGELAVNTNGMALEYVPEELVTADVCKTAVSQNGLAIQFVPEDLLTDDLCKLAVTQNKEAIAYVPEDMRSDGVMALVGDDAECNCGRDSCWNSQGRPYFYPQM